MGGFRFQEFEATYSVAFQAHCNIGWVCHRVFVYPKYKGLHFDKKKVCDRNGGDLFICDFFGGTS